MKKLILSVLFGAAMTVAAYAHSPLKATMPADGETISGTPDMLHLVFAKPARVTKIMLKHTMGDMTHEDKLALPSKKFGTEMMLEPEFKGPGEYTVDWRALGEDGHALKGSFKFTVVAE